MSPVTLLYLSCGNSIVDKQKSSDSKARTAKQIVNQLRNEDPKNPSNQIKKTNQGTKGPKKSQQPNSNPVKETEISFYN